MKKQISACVETFPLNAAGIDRFSGILEEQLTLRGVERENRIRIRLSLEESLLRMRDHFGEDGAFGLTVDRRLGRVQIRIEHEGDIFNPLSKTQAELEDWSGSLLTAREDEDWGFGRPTPADKWICRWSAEEEM